MKYYTYAEYMMHGTITKSSDALNWILKIHLQINRFSNRMCSRASEWANEWVFHSVLYQMLTSSMAYVPEQPWNIQIVRMHPIQLNDDWTDVG